MARNVGKTVPKWLVCAKCLTWSKTSYVRWHHVSDDTWKHLLRKPGVLRGTWPLQTNVPCLSDGESVVDIPSRVDIGSKGPLHRQTKDMPLFSNECGTIRTLQLCEVLREWCVNNKREAAYCICIHTYHIMIVQMMHYNWLLNIQYILSWSCSKIPCQWYLIKTSRHYSIE